jgi:hypothetical protein
MKRALVITIAALSIVGATTAASAQTIPRSQLAQDNYVRSNSPIYQTYLPGQGGCVDDNGYGRLSACGD